MNARAGIKVDKATFYRFIERQTEGRFEFDRGSIVQLMSGGTYSHSKLIKRLEVALDRQLDSLEWEVTSQSRGVDTGETVRYPDIVVEAAGADERGLSTGNPMLVIEVLSPSTEEVDLNVKPGEYMSLPSLVAYIVASQTSPRLTVWQRDVGGGFPDAPEFVEGPDAVLLIEALAVDIALAEIYRRMTGS